MLLALFFAGTGLLAAGGVVYFYEYLTRGEFLYWTWPLYFLAGWLGITLLYVLLLSFYALFLPHKEAEKPSRFVKWLVQITAEWLVWLFRIKPRLVNGELIKEGVNYCFISNHQAWIDPIILIALFPRHKIGYIVKHEAMDFPLLGRLLFKAGFISLDRANIRDAVKMVRYGTRFIKQNSLGIFPEGRRTPDNLIHEFKAGAFKIAERTKAPIALVLLDHVHDSLFNRLRVRPHRALVKIVGVYEYAEYGKYSSQVLAEMYVAQLKAERTKESLKQ